MSNHYTAKVAESLKLRGWIDEIQAKSLRNELDRHKSCLEVAREIIRDCQMHIEADHIDWSRFQDGPDHDPNYKPEFPEIVDRCHTTLHQINEVLGGDSTKTT